MVNTVVFWLPVELPAKAPLGCCSKEIYGVPGSVALSDCPGCQRREVAQIGGRPCSFICPRTDLACASQAESVRVALGQGCVPISVEIGRVA